MSNKLMESTEKEIDYFRLGNKECNGCKRHKKDVMLTYVAKDKKVTIKSLPKPKDVFEQFKHLGIDKKVLMNVITAAQNYQEGVETVHTEFIDLFMDNKQAESLLNELQKTLERNK